MMLWLRKWYGRNYVKLIRRVGEDEVLEISFNERDGRHTIERTAEWLDFLYARMLDHNRRVLELGATMGGTSAEHTVKRIK